jgi:OFA family oxalate/formate antiporter-like MFS transporter
MKKNRWLNAAIPGVGIHLSIGSVYAWSVFVLPVAKEFGISAQDAQWAFSIAICFLGLATAFLGKHIEKIGPRKSAFLCCLCFGTGLIGSGIAVMLKSAALLYLMYGALGGIGLGVGYLTPVKPLIAWFKDKKGLSTGLAVMGFGFSGLIASNLIQALIPSVGLAGTFFVLAAIYTAVIFASALLICNPCGEDGDTADKAGNGPKQYEVSEAMRTWRFYAIWAILFINLVAGLSLISIASPLLQESVRLSAAAAAGLVGILAVFNGGGRFAWAAVSDYLGRPRTYALLIGTEVIAFILLTVVKAPFAFVLLLWINAFCYGGVSSCLPALICDIFGSRNINAIQGRMMTATAAAGITGPLLSAWLQTATGSFNGMLAVFSAVLLASMGLALALKRAGRQSAGLPGRERI